MVGARKSKEQQQRKHRRSPHLANFAHEAREDRDVRQGRLRRNLQDRNVAEGLGVRREPPAGAGHDDPRGDAMAETERRLRLAWDRDATRGAI